MSSIESAPAAIPATRDRKSTRLNSSHLVISYAVFCLKKKKDNYDIHLPDCPTHAVRVDPAPSPATRHAKPRFAPMPPLPPTHNTALYPTSTIRPSPR